MAIEVGRLTSRRHHRVIQCDYCGRRYELAGLYGIFVHLVQEHPDTPTGQAILRRLYRGRPFLPPPGEPRN